MQKTVAQWLGICCTGFIHLLGLFFSAYETFIQPQLLCHDTVLDTEGVKDNFHIAGVPIILLWLLVIPGYTECSQRPRCEPE